MPLLSLEVFLLSALFSKGELTFFQRVSEKLKFAYFAVIFLAVRGLVKEGPRIVDLLERRQLPGHFLPLEDRLQSLELLLQERVVLELHRQLLLLLLLDQHQLFELLVLVNEFPVFDEKLGLLFFESLFKILTNIEDSAKRQNTR